MPDFRNYGTRLLTPTPTSSQVLDMERITGLHRFIPRPTHNLAGRVNISPVDSCGQLVLTFGGFQNLLAPLYCRYIPQTATGVPEVTCLILLLVFKSIGSVLDQCVSDWKRDTGLPLDRFVPKVKEAILHMSDEYHGGQPPDIPFDCLVYRSAYLYEYAPANALAIEAVLNDDAEDQGLISSLLTSKRRIWVCCLGGGPGSEILGVAKWIVRQQLVATQLQVVVIDKYQEWQDQWKSVRNTLNTNFSVGSAISAKRLPLVVPKGFVGVDVIDPKSAQLPALTRGFDLYVVSYVVSHIYTDDGLSQFCKSMQSVIDSAPKGSKFLFIDRHERERGWNKSVTILLNHPGIEISGPYFSSSVSPGDPREEKTDLGVLYEHLNRFPRLGWDIFWVVGTKV